MLDQATYIMEAHPSRPQRTCLAVLVLIGAITASVAAQITPPTTEGGFAQGPLGAAGIPLAADSSMTRSLTDRPDDTDNWQFHIIYAVPKNGEDRHFGTNNAIERCLASVNSWFAGQTGGRRLRLDTWQGHLDVTFLTVDLPDDTTMMDAFVNAVAKAGFTHYRKKYLVFHAGVAPRASRTALPGTG